MVAADRDPDDSLGALHHRFGHETLRLVDYRGEGRASGVRNALCRTAAGRWLVFLDDDPRPAPGALVSVRPDLNAFLGQMTERKYRWMEATADAEPVVRLVPGHGAVVDADGAAVLREVAGRL